MDGRPHQYWLPPPQYQTSRRRQPQLHKGQGRAHLLALQRRLSLPKEGQERPHQRQGKPPSKEDARGQGSTGGVRGNRARSGGGGRHRSMSADVTGRASGRAERRVCLACGGVLGERGCATSSFAGMMCLATISVPSKGGRTTRRVGPSASAAGAAAAAAGKRKTVVAPAAWKQARAAALTEGTGHAAPASTSAAATRAERKGP